MARRSWVKNIYLVKDLSAKSGLSVYTIKYYLNLGLLREIGRSPDTNFRYFDDSSLRRLLEIRRMRKHKLSIKEIAGRLGNN